MFGRNADDLVETPQRPCGSSNGPSVLTMPVYNGIRDHSIWRITSELQLRSLPQLGVLCAFVNVSSSHVRIPLKAPRSLDATLFRKLSYVPPETVIKDGHCIIAI